MAACQVIPSFLYLSGYHAGHNAKLLRELGITHLLNVAGADKPTPTEIVNAATITVLSLPLNDTPAQEMPFEQCFEFIEKSRNANGKCLVHCNAGISRSAAVVIHYIMKSKSVSLKESYDTVKGKKLNIEPNAGFIRQLIDEEERLMGCRSMDAAEYALSLLQRIFGQTREVVEDVYKKAEGNYELAANRLMDMAPPADVTVSTLTTSPSISFASQGASLTHSTSTSNMPGKLTPSASSTLHYRQSSSGLPSSKTRFTLLIDAAIPPAFEILPKFLFLSSYETGHDLEKLLDLGITHVLNVAKDRPPPDTLASHRGLSVLHLPLLDTPDQEIPFSTCFDFIESARESHGRCLVHCNAGVSRSTTVVLYYLMRTQKMALREAFLFVKEKKSDVAPNDGFLEQLLREERRLTGTETMNLLEYRLDLLVEHTHLPRDRVRDVLNACGGDPYLALTRMIVQNSDSD